MKDDRRFAIHIRYLNRGWDERNKQTKIWRKKFTKESNITTITQLGIYLFFFNFSDFAFY